MNIDPRALLRKLFDAAVASALPGRVLAAHLPPPPAGRTLVIGAGKAGGAMAQALEAAWPADAPLSGLVITRYGHVPSGWRARRLEVVEAAHPVPDAQGLAASERLLALTRGLTAQDLVICLISGGGSALLSLPAPGLTLADKQAVNRALLASGAAIGEMNCVRKHLSAIKGGRLAAACAPAQVLTLTISDVPGDDPAIIASGPTVADATTCADALAICRRYRIELPPAALAGLTSGAFETPKPGDPRLDGHRLVMLSTPQMSLEAAAATARHGSSSPKGASLDGATGTPPSTPCCRHRPPNSRARRPSPQPDWHTATSRTTAALPCFPPSAPPRNGFCGPAPAPRTRPCATLLMSRS